MNNNKFGSLFPHDICGMFYLIDFINNNFAVNDTIKIVEIGVATGATLKGIKDCFEEKNRKVELWGIDINPRIDTHFEFCLIKDDSFFAYNKIPNNIHFIFVDGCHCKNHVVFDFLNYSKKIIKNGVIAFHDSFPNYKFIEYQHGPELMHESYVCVRGALKDLGLLDNKLAGWKLIFDAYEGIGGGITAFTRID